MWSFGVSRLVKARVGEMVGLTTFRTGEIPHQITGNIHLNNTYKAIRVVGKSYNFYYSVWCNNEHELYDLNVGIPQR